MTRNTVYKFICFAVIFFCAVNLYAEISVKYFGGAGRVSGSCALLKTGSQSVIIDCGMFYAEDGLGADNETLSGELIKAKALILTHAHIDHSGRIPYLINKGFKGNVYCTPATKKIVFEMYNDGWNFEDIKRKYFWSAAKLLNIQNAKRGTLILHWNDLCRKSIKNISESEKSVSMSDLRKKYNINLKVCKKCLSKYLSEIEKQFKEVIYKDNIKLSDNISFSFFNAGHISGSASVLFAVRDGNKNIKIVFSGDLGSGYSKLTPDYDIIPKVDCVFVESTYAGANKNISTDDYDNFQNSVSQSLKNDKIVWIPSLSLHRTQKVLYEIKQAQIKKLIDKNIPVFSLSPSSNGITNLYESEIKDKSEQRWFKDEVYNMTSFLPGKYVTVKPKQFPKPSIVISASGMMDGGTSLHLINKLLPLEYVKVYLVSYVAPDTPAWRLKNGAKIIKTKYGVTKVLAQVESFDIFSDHTDINGILKWLSNQTASTKIYLVHGNNRNLQQARILLHKNGFLKTYIAVAGENDVK